MDVKLARKYSFKVLYLYGIRIVLYLYGICVVLVY